ncbi:unc-89 [Symbiodinium sp. CCMP2456]|nr:unc-89 [Symbiodinium sp. CCMP2456]
MVRSDYACIPASWNGQTLAYTDPGITTGHSCIDHIATCLHVTLAFPNKTHRARHPVRIDARAVADPAHRDTVSRIIRGAPKPSWQVDVSEHAARVVDYLYCQLSRAFPVRRRRLRASHLSSDAQALHGLVATLRHNIRTHKTALQWALLRCVLSVWKGGCGSFAAVFSGRWLWQLQHRFALSCMLLHRTGRALRRQCRVDRAEFFTSVADDIARSSPGELHSTVKRVLRPKKFRRSSADPLPLLYREDGTICSTDTQVLEAWREHFSALEDGQTASVESLVQSCRTWQTSFSGTEEVDIARAPTMALLVEAFRATSAHKACGPDMLPPAICHHFAPDLAILFWPMALKTILSAAEAVGLKGGILHHIPKPTSAMQNVCSGHRGILVQSCIAKAMHRTMRTLAVGQWLPHSMHAQLGGRKGCSANFGHFCSRAFLASCKDRGHSGGILFVDLAAAYYSVVREIVVGDRLCSRGVADIASSLRLSPEDLQVMQSHIAEQPVLQSQAAAPLFIELARELHNHTWFMLSGDSTLVRTYRGTRPGGALADVIFNILFSRVLRRRCNEGLAGTSPALRWDGARTPFIPCPSSAPLLEVQDIVFADDLASLVISRQASGLRHAVSSVAAATLDVLPAHGLTANLGPKKTAALLAVCGPGSRAARRELFTTRKGRLPVCLEHSGAVHLDLVTSYRHLGSVLTSSGELGAEICHRLALGRAAFREGKTRLFACQRIPLHRRAVLFRSHVLSTILSGCGTWPILRTGEWKSFSGGILSLYRQMLGLWKENWRVTEVLGRLQVPDPASLLAAERLRADAAKRAHPQAPAESGPGARTPETELAETCVPLLLSLEASLPETDEEIFQIVCSHVAPLPLIRDTLQQWRDTLADTTVQDACDDVLLVLHPVHICEKVSGSVQQQPDEPVFQPQILPPAYRPTTTPGPVLWCGRLCPAWVSLWGLDLYPPVKVDFHDAALPRLPVVSGICIVFPPPPSGSFTVSSIPACTVRSLRLFWHRLHRCRTGFQSSLETGARPPDFTPYGKKERSKGSRQSPQISDMRRQGDSQALSMRYLWLQSTINLLQVCRAPDKDSFPKPAEKPNVAMNPGAREFVPAAQLLDAWPSYGCEAAHLLPRAALAELRRLEHAAALRIQRCWRQWRAARARKEAKGRRPKSRRRQRHAAAEEWWAWQEEWSSWPAEGGLRRQRGKSMSSRTQWWSWEGAEKGDARPYHAQAWKHLPEAPKTLRWVPKKPASEFQDTATEVSTMVSGHTTVKPRWTWRAEEAKLRSRSQPPHSRRSTTPPPRNVLLPRAPAQPQPTRVALSRGVEDWPMAIGAPPRRNAAAVLGELPQEKQGFLLVIGTLMVLELFIDALVLFWVGLEDFGTWQLRIQHARAKEYAPSHTPYSDQEGLATLLENAQGTAVWTWIPSPRRGCDAAGKAVSLRALVVAGADDTDLEAHLRTAHVEETRRKTSSHRRVRRETREATAEALPRTVRQGSVASADREVLTRTASLHEDVRRPVEQEDLQEAPAGEETEPVDAEMGEPEMREGEEEEAYHEGDEEEDEFLADWQEAILEGEAEAEAEMAGETQEEFHEEDEAPLFEAAAAAASSADAPLEEGLSEAPEVKEEEGPPPAAVAETEESDRWPMQSRSPSRQPVAAEGPAEEQEENRTEQHRRHIERRRAEVKAGQQAVRPDSTAEDEVSARAAAAAAALAARRGKREEATKTEKMDKAKTEKKRKRREEAAVAPPEQPSSRSHPPEQPEDDRRAIPRKRRKEEPPATSPPGEAGPPLEHPEPEPPQQAPTAAHVAKVEPLEEAGEKTGSSKKKEKKKEKKKDAAEEPRSSRGEHREAAQERKARDDTRHHERDREHRKERREKERKEAAGPTQSPVKEERRRRREVADASDRHGSGQKEKTRDRRRRSH